LFSERSQKEEAVIKRREAIQKGSKIEVGSKLKAKLDEAESRRIKL
jgi:hypothetical protein